MSGRISTHVLDTVAGKPAAGVRIELYALEGGETTGAPASKPVAETITNEDGRTDAPLLSGDEFTSGSYRIVFHAGAYHRAAGYADAGRFLETVPIDFVVTDSTEGYHVPLLVTPWSYSTYRGS